MYGNLYSQFKPDEASARQKLVRAIIFLAGKLKSRSHGRKGEWVPRENATRVETGNSLSPHVAWWRTNMVH